MARRRETPIADEFRYAQSPRELALTDIHARLRLKFPANEYALFHEVRNATGFVGRPRYADAIAMGLWPSRGLQLEGFEIKVDRGDWLNELRKPEKADAIARYCDLWWLVTPADRVAELPEIPPTWGWLVPHGKTFKVAKPATPNRAPEPIDREFMASVFRAAQSDASVEARLRAQREGFARELEQARAYAKECAERDGSRLREAVAKFEKASGLHIETYGGDELGKRVAALRALEDSGGSVEDLVRRALQRTERDRDRLAEVLAMIAPEGTKVPA